MRTGAEYARVFEQARRTSDPLLSLHWLAGETPARLGLAVSRKVDPNAVGRNRIKRVIRDQFRKLRAQLPGGDYVLSRAWRRARPTTRSCARLSCARWSVPAHCPLGRARHNAAGQGITCFLIASFPFRATRPNRTSPPVENACPMNQTRMFLIFAWLMVATLLWMEWGKFNAPKPAAIATPSAQTLPRTGNQDVGAPSTGTLASARSPP